jgi:dsRNA-specific ribonuclease
LSDENSFFEWARKTSSFSELVSAYKSLQLIRRIQAVPQIEGEKPTPLTLALWRSFLEKENTVVLMPSLVNIDRLPLLMCATYMHKQASRHIVWLTKETQIVATKSRLESLVKSRNWRLDSLDDGTEGTFLARYRSNCAIYVVSPDKFVHMMREGAPLSKIALILVSCTADLLSSDAAYHKSLKHIFDHFSCESPIIRPKVCFLANNLDFSVEVVSDVLPQLASHVPALSVATCTQSELDKAMISLKQAPKSYLCETPVPTAFTAPLLDQLHISLRNLLSLYVEEAELASLAGIYKMEAAKGTTPTEAQKRASYLNPLIPFHRHLEPIIHETGLVNQRFIASLDLIEPRWESCGLKLILVTIRDLCTNISLLADIGIADACEHLSTTTNFLLEKISKRKSPTPLDNLHSELSELSSFIQYYRSEYLGFGDSNSSGKLTTSQKTACRYKGRLSLLLQLLTPFRSDANSRLIKPLNSDALHRIMDIYTCSPEFDVSSWVPRFVVHLSDPRLTKFVKLVISETLADSSIFGLGEATDEVTCDEFFEHNSGRPAVLLSVPSSSRLVQERMIEHNKQYEKSSNPKYIPGALYGPHRIDSTSNSVPSSHHAFHSDSTRHHIITIRLDSDSPALMLKALQQDEYSGQIIVSPKLPTFSLASALQTLDRQSADLIDTVCSDHDAIANCRKTLDEIRAKQLKLYTPGAPLSPVPTSSLPHRKEGAVINKAVEAPRSLEPTTTPTTTTPLSSFDMLTPMPLIEEVVDAIDKTPFSPAGAMAILFPGGKGGSFLDSSDPWSTPTTTITSPSPAKSALVTSGEVTPTEPTRTPSADPVLVVSSPISQQPQRNATSQPQQQKHQKHQSQQHRAFLNELLDDECPTLPPAKGSFGFDMRDIAMPAMPQGSTKTVLAAKSVSSPFSPLSSPDLPSFQPPSLAEMAAHGTAQSIMATPVLSMPNREPTLFGETPRNEMRLEMDPHDYTVPSLGHMGFQGLNAKGDEKVSILGSPATATAAAAAAGLIEVDSSPLPLSYTQRVLAALDISPSVRSDTNSDPVSLLHIYFSKIGGTDPEYDEIMCGGSDHARNYRSTCTLASGQTFEGWGMRKKDAKKAAAAYALEFITHVPAAAYLAETSSASGSRLVSKAGSILDGQKRETMVAAISPSSAILPSERTAPPHSDLLEYAPQAIGRAAPPPSTTGHQRPGVLTLGGSIPSPAPIHPPALSFGSLQSFGGYGVDAAPPPSANALTFGSSFPTYSAPNSRLSSSLASSSSSDYNDHVPAYLLGTISPGMAFHNPPSLVSSHAQPSTPLYDLSTAQANPIGVVNEYHQKRGIKPPVYTDAGRTAGSDHDPSFLCYVTIFDGRRFEAKGSSKKEAKTNAAFSVAVALGLVGQ